MRKLRLFLFVILPLYMHAQEDRLTPEKLWQLGRVSLDDVSPDGKTAVYGVSWFDVAANNGQRDLYLAPVQGGATRKITAFEGSKSNARYRPDGRKIAFLRGGLLWEMNPDGSDQKQVSGERMTGFEWSPTGKHILFTRPVKMAPTTADLYPDLPLAEGRIYDDLMYRHWDSWFDYTFNQVFYVAYENGSLVGEPINILNEPYDSPTRPFGGTEQVTWSPDGRFIAYTCKKESGKDYALSTNTDIYLFELSSSRTTNVSEGMPGYDKNPFFSPDGHHLLWNSMERPGFEADRYRLFRYDLRSGQREELSAGMDMSVHQPAFSDDGRTIYFQSDLSGTVQLFSLTISNRKVTQLTEGVHNYAGFKVAGPNTLVAARMSMSDPAELYRVELPSGKATAITATNGELWGSIRKGKVESRTIQTTDGKDMLVWVIYPPGFDPAKKYPTLLYCQGGPQSAVSQFFSYRWNFQIMAAHDYIIVAPNRRGLPGFGQDWNDAISEDWGGQAMQDKLSAIDALKSEPFIDEERLGAIGASYGGYAVYWLAGNHDGRFKSFISHCGLYNLESWYGTTEELFFANWDVGGAYWDNPVPESYKKHSPHLYVHKWDTPILVIHGEKDFRVPIGEGMQAFQAAQLQGIPSRFLYFPDEGHWVMKPQNGILWHRVFYEWLENTLR